MKTFEEYLQLPYRLELIEDPDEGGYVASYPDLPGCLSSGETVEAAVSNAREAKQEWIHAAIEDDIAIPEPVNLEGYSGQFKLRLPRSLHKTLAEHSKAEGVSMNQYCVYLLSQRDALHSV